MAAAKTWRCARCVIACDGVEPGHALESLDIGRHGTVLISGHSTYDNRRRPAWVRFNARCRCYGHLDRSRSLVCFFFFTHGAPCIVLDPFNCCMRHRGLAFSLSMQYRFRSVISKWSCGEHAQCKVKTIKYDRV